MGVNVSENKINNFRTNTVHRSEIISFPDHTNNEISCELENKKITRLIYPFQDFISNDFKKLITLISSNEFTISEFREVYNNLDPETFLIAMNNLSNLLDGLYQHIEEVIECQVEGEGEEEEDEQDSLYTQVNNDYEQ